MSKSKLKRGVFLLLSLVIMTPTLLGVFYSPTATAAPNCPRKQDFCNDVKISARFVDQNLVEVTFAGHYLNSSGQTVNLSFLNTDNGAGYYYADNPDGTNYKLGGNKGWKGYGGECTNTSSPNEQPILEFYTGAPFISLDQNILQPSNLNAKYYALTITNLYYPDSAIDTNGGTLTGGSTCGQKNRMAFVNHNYGADNGSPGGVKNSNVPNGVLGTGDTIDDPENNNNPNTVAVLGDNRPSADLGVGSTTPPAEITYVLAGDGKIYRSDNDPNYDATTGKYIFSPDSSPSKGDVQPRPNGFTQYISNYTTNGCPDVLSISSASVSMIAPAKINHGTKNGNLCANPNASDGKGVSVNVAGNFQPNSAPTSAGGAASSASGSGSGGGGGSDTASCVNNAGTFGWMFCEIIDGVTKAETWAVNNILNPYLKTNPINFTSCNTSNNATGCDPTDTYSVWSNFRKYGDILLVLALLAVVFGEVIGGGVIDAYTAKKMLPRILAAAILINLSIYIVAIAIDVTNILGQGINSLITAPISSAYHGLPISIGNGVGIAGLTTMFGAAGLIYGGGLAGIGYIVLTVLLPFALASLAVVVTLIFRRALIVFLVFVSPIAFALYVLPNTEHYFKKWWEILTKALLIYPLIGIFFAMATVMGVILNANDTGSAIQQIMSLLALVIPFFLIPYAFKMAGGIMGAIHEQATNYRNKAHGAIAGDAKDPNSLRNRLLSRRNLNRAEHNMTMDAAGTMVNPQVWRNGGIGAVRKGLAERRAGYREQAGHAMLESNQVWQDHKADSQFLLAHANRELAEKRMEEARADANNASLSAQDRQKAAQKAEQWEEAIHTADLVPRTRASQMVSAQAWLASGFDIAKDGQTAYNEMAETMASITGASVRKDNLGNVVGFAGANSGAAINALSTAQASMARNGQLHMSGIDRGTGYDAKAGLDKASLYEISNGKAEAVKNMVETLGTSGPLSQDHMVAYKELEAMLPNSKGGVRDEIVKQMSALETRGVKAHMEMATASGNKIAERYNEAKFLQDAAARVQSGEKTGTWTAAQEAMSRGWTASEISAGRRERSETYGDVAERAARKYERINPDQIS